MFFGLRVKPLTLKRISVRLKANLDFVGNYLEKCKQNLLFGLKILGVEVFHKTFKRNRRVLLEEVRSIGFYQRLII